MERLLTKYTDKIRAAGLADRPLLCGLDDRLVWNRTSSDCAVLEEVLAGMNINALLAMTPAEPYQTMLNWLCRRYPQTITPGDCETRTFLHDLPIGRQFTSSAILPHLRRRKSVLVAQEDHIRLITFGTVSPEQAFVTASSVCFAAFVLFFSDYLHDLRAGRVDQRQQAAFDRAVAHLATPPATPPPLATGPFTSRQEVEAAMIAAGRATVEYGLVDSYFGNISYRLDETIYISQTGSSLDELAGCIDPCPMDDSSSAGITASSELTAHTEIYLRSWQRAILHGHPRFAVILSMDCDQDPCVNRGSCHLHCRCQREINGIPIVPGEVGTGPTGLCHTLPPAMVDKPGAIVWGHGLFTTGQEDFNQAFSALLEIETMCRQHYFSRLHAAS